MAIKALSFYQQGSRYAMQESSAAHCHKTDPGLTLRFVDSFILSLLALWASASCGLRMWLNVKLAS
jgi:hypothetical protein